MRDKYNLKDILSFGRHEGKTIETIIRFYNSYMEYLLQGKEGFPKFELDGEANKLYKEIWNEQYKLRSENRKINYHYEDKQRDADFFSTYDWGSQ